MTEEVLDQSSLEVIAEITHSFNATFRLKFVTKMFNVADILSTTEHGKRPHGVLSMISKLYEKIVLKRIK